MKTSGMTQALKKASQGLLFPSETDAPFEPFEWPGEQGKPDKARVLELAGLPPNTPVKVEEPGRLLQGRDQGGGLARRGGEGGGPEVQAARAGAQGGAGGRQGVPGGQGVESDVYIVGRPEAGWAGLKTKVVET